jgi:thiamine biosynthesis lipoprotein
MSVHQNVSRRNALKIITSAVGMSLLPGAAGRSSATIPSVHWRGIVMNAPAQLHLYGIDRTHGQRSIRRAILEARRLEAIFSLYRPDSAVRRLNQNGRIAAPPPELVELLNEACAISVVTDGAFDVTMQPLWQLYAMHFAQVPEVSEGPPADELARVSELIDYRFLTISSDEISFARKGMAVSLNGIVQGYVTDRVTDLLRAEGFANMTVDLGEARMTGTRPDGAPWGVAIQDPTVEGKMLDSLSLSDGAVATSQPAGTIFEPTGRHHHLFDPRTGRSVNYYRSVTVQAANATRADGLSTGLSILPPERLRAVSRSFADVRAVVLKADGLWLDSLS